jgi:hypothetical protein
MNKNIFMVLAVLFMVFVGLQFAEPAAAAKVVDHGTKYAWNGQDGYIKVTWKTYQYNNNFLKSYVAKYIKDSKTKRYEFGCDEEYVFAKVTKNSIKITNIADWLVDFDQDPVQIGYYKTKLTGAQYYWRVFRPQTLLKANI